MISGSTGTIDLAAPECNGQSRAIQVLVGLCDSAANIHSATSSRKSNPANITPSFRWKGGGEGGHRIKLRTPPSPDLATNSSRPSLR